MTAEPLTGYPLPDEAYTDEQGHLCILPAVSISPETRPGWAMLPLGTRWRCEDCGAVYLIVRVARGRDWQPERIGD